MKSGIVTLAAIMAVGCLYAQDAQVIINIDAENQGPAVHPALSI